MEGGSYKLPATRRKRGSAHKLTLWEARPAPIPLLFSLWEARLAPTWIGSKQRMKAKSPNHSADLRTGRTSLPGHVYFITKCLDRANELNLGQNPLASIVCEAILQRKKRGMWHLLCFVLMPDHLHLLIALGEGISLSQSVANFSSFTAHRINAALIRTGIVWQEGFYDHALRRSVEKCPDLTQYIHNNPVRKGLCSTPEDWPWSTAHALFAGEIESEWFW